MDISIIIPCFNEEDNIPPLAKRLKPVLTQLRQAGQGLVEVVFVDDGSSDATFERLQAAFADAPTSQIVRHPHNRGLGEALRTGLKAARGQVIVTTDSDGTYDFASIPRLLAALEPGIDVVTASPYHPQGGVGVLPAYRLALSRGCSMIYRLLVDRHIYTYTAIFRAYRRPVLENVDWGSRGYLAVTQMLVEARLKGYRVAEVPLALNVRHYGQSKAKVIRIMRDHLRYQMRLLLRQVASRLRGQPWAEAQYAPSPRASRLEAK
ncbi:MAG: glycosyltransferase family 2 protein [Chloroflexota bacterium]